MNSNDFKKIDIAKPVKRLVEKTSRNPYMNSKPRTEEEHIEHTELSFKLMDKVVTLFHNCGLKTKRCEYTNNQPYQYSIKDIDTIRSNTFNIFAKVNMEDTDGDFTYIKLDKILNGFLDIIFVFKQHKINNNNITFKHNDIEIILNSNSNEEYEYEFKGFMFIDDILEKYGENKKEFKIYYEDLENDIGKFINKLNKEQKIKNKKINKEITDIVTSLCPNYYKSLNQSFYTSKTYFETFDENKKRIKNIWNFVSNFGNKFSHSYTNSQIDYSVRTIISMKLFLRFKNIRLLPAYVTMRDCNLNINDNNFLENYAHYFIANIRPLNNEHIIFKEKINNVNNSTFSLDEIKYILKNTNCIKTICKKSSKRNNNKKSK